MYIYQRDIIPQTNRILETDNHVFMLNIYPPMYFLLIYYSIVPLYQKKFTYWFTITIKSKKRDFAMSRKMVFTRRLKTLCFYGAYFSENVGRYKVWVKEFVKRIRRSPFGLLK